MLALLSRRYKMDLLEMGGVELWSCDLLKSEFHFTLLSCCSSSSRSDPDYFSHKYHIYERFEIAICIAFPGDGEKEWWKKIRTHQQLWSNRPVDNCDRTFFQICFNLIERWMLRMQVELKYISIRHFYLFFFSLRFFLLVIIANKKFERHGAQWSSFADVMSNEINGAARLASCARKKK